MSPALWVAMAAISLVMVTPWVRVTTDEAWFLVVCRRVARGEALYREVFFGAGPLPAWIGAAASRLGRPQLVLLRLLGVVYVATSTAGVAVLVLLVGGEPRTALVAGLASVLLGGVHASPHNHYGLFTVATTIWALSSLVAGQPLWAGLLVGAGIAAKFNLGVAATVAALPLAWTLGGGAAVITMAMTAALVLAACAAALRGDLAWFWQRAIRNKGTYLTAGRLSPRTWWLRRWKTGGRARADLIGPSTVLVATVLAPAGIIVGVGATLRVGPETLPGSLLLTLGLIALVPRVDPSHLAAAAPLLVAGLSLVSIPLGVDPTAGLAVAGATGLAALALRPMELAGARRDLPSLRFMPVVRSGDAWPDETDDLDRCLPTFVLRTDAPLVYAAGGLRNPTPFDYPFRSTFGPIGQREVVSAIEDGTIRQLVVGWEGGGVHTPTELLAAVEALPTTATVRLGELKQLQPGPTLES